VGTPKIGEETHPDTDQIPTFVIGTGEADAAGQTRQVAQGDLVAVPAGAQYKLLRHQRQPAGPLRRARPTRARDGVVQATKEEADAADASGQDNDAHQPLPSLP
jgi:mannose-6-phosphate isomerase-like protein (cupin superfamily)